MELHNLAHLVRLKLLNNRFHRKVQRHPAILAKLVHQALHQPLANIGRSLPRADGFQNPVGALAHQSFFVKLYLIGRELSQLACKGTQSLLEELVYGAYRKS